MAAILPDLDGFLHLITGLDMLEHAVFTHTIIGAFLLAFIYTTIVWFVGRTFFLKLNIDYKFLIIACLLGVTSHLILDIFTYREDIYTTDAHLYFWPIWNASFHLNLFFHQSTYPNIYLVRVLIEIIYSTFLVILIFIYGWIRKKENPLSMFSPNNWLSYLSNDMITETDTRSVFILLLINLAMFGLMIFAELWGYL